MKHGRSLFAHGFERFGMILGSAAQCFIDEARLQHRAGKLLEGDN